MIMGRRQPNRSALDAPRRRARTGLGDGDVKYLILAPRGRRQQLDEEGGGIFTARYQLSHLSLLHVVDAGLCRGSLGPPYEGRIPGVLLGSAPHANFGKILPGTDSVV